MDIDISVRLNLHRIYNIITFVTVLRGGAFTSQMKMGGGGEYKGLLTRKVMTPTTSLMMKMTAYPANIKVDNLSSFDRLPFRKIYPIQVNKKNSTAVLFYD